MSKNACYCYMLLSWMMLFSPIAVTAEGVSPKPSNRLASSNSMPETSLPDSDDFARRVIASYLLLQNMVTLAKTMIGKLESDGPKDSLLKPLELLQENLLVRLTLAKYLTRQEMDTLIEFLDTAEIISILTKITRQSMFPREPVQWDIDSFIQEIKAIYFMTIVRGWLGKTTDDTVVSFPVNGIEVQPFTADKIEVRDRLTAARQVVESCLPLIEGTIIRMLNQQVKEEVKDMEIEGSRISLAVRSMMDNLREDPILVLVLARHFEAKELSAVAYFLSREEIRLGVDRLSRMWVSPQGGKLKHDWGRVLQEFTTAFTGIFEGATHNTSQPQGTEPSKKAKGESGTEASKKAKGETGKTETAKSKVEKTEGGTAGVPGNK